MSLKDLAKNVTYATERMRLCENALAAAIRRRDELSGKETEMRLELARLDSETERLSDPGMSLADSLTESARLAQQRMGVVAMVEQLERIGDRAGADIASAQVNLVSAEVDIVEAQRQFFGESLRDQIDEFWSTNRAALQRMLTVAYAVDLLRSAPQNEHMPAPSSSVCRLEHLLDAVLCPALIARSDADEAFDIQRDGERGMPAPSLVLSDAIGNEARRRIATMLQARMPTEAIVTRVLQMDAAA